jgi:hypothetical protein
MTRRGASSLRGEAFEDGFERDPANAVLRTIPLKIDPALVKAVEHPDAGQWMLHSLRAEQRHLATWLILLPLSEGCVDFVS